MAEAGVAHPTGAGLAREPTGTASLEPVSVASSAIDAERKAATPSPDVALGCDTSNGSRRRGKDGRGASAAGGPANGNCSRTNPAGKQSSCAPAARKPAARSASGGLMGCAPSWADKTWHPMAVTVASGQIRNGGTGVFIPGGMRPAASSAGGCASSGGCAPAAASCGISSSSMSSSISAAGSGGPGSPQGSPAAPGSPAGDVPPKQDTPGGPAPLPRPVSAPSAHPPLLPSGAAFPLSGQGAGFASGGHNLGTGAFIPATGRAAYASSRRSLDVRPTQPQLSAAGPVRRTSDSHLAGGPAGGAAGGNNAASAAAAAAAAVDAAAQALAAAQAAAAAAGSGAVSPADSITMQVAMMQLQQQQAQLQQLQQQADLQQQLHALQRESLLAQLQGDAGGLLSAASAPCNIQPDHAHNGGFLSGDNLWATRSGAFLSHASLVDSAAFATQNSLALSNTGLVGGFVGLLSPASSVPQPASAAPSLIGCGPVDAPGLAQSPIGLDGGLATAFGTAPGISAASIMSGGGAASGPLLSGLTAGLGTIDEAQAGVGTFNLRGAAATSFAGQW